jgi:gamma-glutamyl-gamma-aminobutyrate hydrolase PuuD
MVKRSGKKRGRRRPLIGITCEVHKIRPYYSEFELTCDYRYARAIIRAGGNPFIVPINHNRTMVKSLLEEMDGLVIVGGDDINPSFYGEKSRHRMQIAYRGRVRYETMLYKMACRRRLPVLAICYGMQLLNVMYGGSLYQDIRRQVSGSMHHASKRKPIHRVKLETGSKLAQILKRNSILVHSEHHQAVKRLAHRLSVCARSKDGVVEAIEGLPNTLAVQWHPERQARDPIQKRLFSYFVKQCRAFSLL